MLLVYAVIDLKEPLAPADTAKFLDHQKHALDEPGCYLYIFSTDLENPRRIHVIERFESNDMMTKHMQTPRSVAFAAWMKDHAAGVSVNRYTVGEDQSDAFRKESTKLMGDTVKG